MRQRDAAEAPDEALRETGDSAGEVEEQALIAACRAGDRTALAAVLGRHIQVLERVILKLVWDQMDAEDVLQQTLTTAVECFPRFRGESAIQTWLIGIAIGISRNHSRRQKRVRDRAAPPSSTATLLAGEVTVEERAHDRALLKRLEQHLSQLSTKRREVWVLHVLEGRSLQEVATIVGTNRFTAKSRLFMARKELRKRMNADPALSPMVRGESA